jgi:hypothetical protein
MSSAIAFVENTIDQHKDAFSKNPALKGSKVNSLPCLTCLNVAYGFIWLV